MIGKLLKKRTLHKLLAQIHCANDYEISQIISAIVRRYSVVYPDQEVLFLSLPINDIAEREQILTSALELLKNA